MFLIPMCRLSCQIRCQNNGNKDAQDQVFIVPGLEYFAVMASHCQEKLQETYLSQVTNRSEKELY